MPERQDVTDKVLADLKERREKFTPVYGEALTTFNGRDALQDAYEEALDQTLYLAQALMEREAKNAGIQGN